MARNKAPAVREQDRARKVAPAVREQDRAHELNKKKAPAEKCSLREQDVLAKKQAKIVREAEKQQQAEAAALDAAQAEAALQADASTRTFANQNEWFLRGAPLPVMYPGEEPGAQKSQ